MVARKRKNTRKLSGGRRKTTKRRGGVYVWRRRTTKKDGDHYYSTERKYNRKTYDQPIPTPYRSDSFKGVVADDPFNITHNGRSYNSKVIYSKRHMKAGVRRGKTRFTPEEYYALSEPWRALEPWSDKYELGEDD